MLSFLLMRKRCTHCCEKCLCPLSFFSSSLLKFSKYSLSSMIILKQCRLNGRYITLQNSGLLTAENILTVEEVCANLLLILVQRGKMTKYINSARAFSSHSLR